MTKFLSCVGQMTKMRKTKQFGEGIQFVYKNVPL